MENKFDSLGIPATPFSSVAGKPAINMQPPSENIGDEQRQDKEPGRNLKEKKKPPEDAVEVELSGDIPDELIEKETPRGSTGSYNAQGQKTEQLERTFDITG